jgi:hypothetical protein
MWYERHNYDAADSAHYRGKIDVRILRTRTKGVNPAASANGVACRTARI